MEKQSLASWQFSDIENVSAQTLHVASSANIVGSAGGEGAIGDPASTAALLDKEVAYVISMSRLGLQAALSTCCGCSLLSKTGAKQSRPGNESIDMEAGAAIAWRSPGDGVAGQSMAGTATSTSGEEVRAASTSPNCIGGPASHTAFNLSGDIATAAPCVENIAPCAVNYALW